MEKEKFQTLFDEINNASDKTKNVDSGYAIFCPECQLPVNISKLEIGEKFKCSECNGVFEITEVEL